MNAPRSRRSPLGTALRVTTTLAGMLALSSCALVPVMVATGATPPGASSTVTTQSATSAAAPTASQIESPSPSATTSGSPAPTASDGNDSGSCPTPPSTFMGKAPGDGKTVALTFDDGPAPADPEILEILSRYKVRATFFFTGAHAENDPEIVTRAASEGHLIADHSWEHLYPSAVDGGWTVSYLTREFKRTDALLSRLAGQAICFYRPPGGNKTNVLKAAGAMGITSVLWNIDTEDWKQPDSTTVAATAAIVDAATTVGSYTNPIVLMHSGKASHEPDSKVSPNRSNTVAALPAIIEWYQSHGYTFVRLDGVS